MLSVPVTVMVKSLKASRNFSGNFEACPVGAGSRANVMILAFPAAIDAGSITVDATTLKRVAGDVGGLNDEAATTAVDAAIAVAQAFAKAVMPSSAFEVGPREISCAANVATLKVNVKVEGTSIAGSGNNPTLSTALALDTRFSAHVANVSAHEVSATFGRRSNSVCHFVRISTAKTLRLHRCKKKFDSCQCRLQKGDSGWCLQG